MQQDLWLIWELTRREVSQRYKGTFLGILWPVLYSILFLSVTVSFDASFGEQPPAVDRPAADPLAALQSELAAAGNWSPTPPPATTQVVSLAPGTSELHLIDPLGGLTVRERAVPLNRLLTRFAVLP